MKSLWTCWAACLPLFACAGIEITLSSSVCQPGDVFELCAESTFEELASFELQLPQHVALHLVAHQRQPIIYANGVYRQKDVWVMQSKQAGSIELKGIKALVQKGEKKRELDLPPQVIEVKPYTASQDDFIPEALPEAPADEPPGGRIGRIMFPAVIALLITIIWMMKKWPKRVAVEAAAPTLDDLQATLKAGYVPEGMVEGLLADESLSISGELRVAMERAVYGQDAGALHALLGKEAAG